MSDVSDIQRLWKRAVIHLEPHGSIDDHRRFVGSIEGWQQQQRWNGTAFILADGSDQFLVTARHVLRGPEGTVQAPPGSEWHFARVLESEGNRIASRIFRVRSLDELISKSSTGHLEEHIGIPGAGTPNRHCFTYSDAATDLAVISLNRDDTAKFREDLRQAGYEPVPIEMVSADFPAEGAEAFTVGFPGGTSIVTTRGEPSAYWGSSLVSIPVFCFGKIAAVHPLLPTFWCDISAYPGNSGGPLVCGDKLAGIVIQQAVVDEQRIPFARVISASQIPALITRQREKDALHSA